MSDTPHYIDAATFDRICAEQRLLERLHGWRLAHPREPWSVPVLAAACDATEGEIRAILSTFRFDERAEWLTQAQFDRLIAAASRDPREAADELARMFPFGTEART